MPDWGLVGLILSSNVIVEIVRLASAGATKRKRAKGKIVTDFELMQTSRSRWMVHARDLRGMWHLFPRPPLPPEPDDPWPPKEKE